MAEGDTTANKRAEGDTATSEQTNGDTAMSEQTTHLPGPAARNDERVKSRDYESDWAQFPAEETDGQLEPGAGPVGSVSSSGTSIPMVLLFIAFGVLFLAFFLPYLPVLLAGVVLLIAAIVSFGVMTPYKGTFHGVGTLKPKHRPTPQESAEG